MRRCIQGIFTTSTYGFSMHGPSQIGQVCHGYVTPTVVTNIAKISAVDELIRPSIFQRIRRRLDGIRQQSRSFYTEAIHFLHTRWYQCINVNGDYL
ncbi:hypothetical protein AVEN_188351-1 [Araneus ventricosus]|uniref:Uncharacterized protein n=1 Tax=Araneus ventricosus TaxID=182803 RepID=A0A4Y2UDR8_ARAVE|nr:hypothetical protein AVEN_188351-1 [Araneus ventricosus]